MPVKPKRRTTKLDIRLPPNLKAQVVQEAERQEMTITLFVETALRFALERARLQ